MENPTQIYLSKLDVESYEAYTSGIRIFIPKLNAWIDLDIQLLAEMVEEYKKANPNFTWFK